MSCTYSSTRTNSVCTEPVTVTYGHQGFCKKHSITVQALLVKQAYETRSKVANEPKLKKIYDLVIKRNERGNFTDEKTNFVFNPITKKVIGFEDEDGDVVPLTDEQKLLCLKRNWVVHNPADDESSSDEDEGEYSSEEYEDDESDSEN